VLSHESRPPPVWLIFNVGQKKHTMNAINPRKEIAAGFFLAAITLCLGFYFGVRAGEIGPFVIQVFGLVSCLIVMKYTFAIGRLRGFSIRKEDGRIDPTNLARNLVASLIAVYCIVFLSAPFIAAIIHHHH
jgi:hypothetical protein